MTCDVQTAQLQCPRHTYWKGDDGTGCWNLIELYTDRILGSVQPHRNLDGSVHDEWHWSRFFPRSHDIIGSELHKTAASAFASVNLMAWEERE